MVMESSPGTFRSATHIAVGPTPVQVEKADFNRDGNVDLAILSIGDSAAVMREYGQTLYVLVGDGAGGFRSPYVVALKEADYPGSQFTVCDVDADGWPDLALLHPSRLHIRVARNVQNGDIPAFDEVAEPIVVPTGSRCITAGDFNDDGRDDLVAGASSVEANSLRVLRSNGDGTFLDTGPAELPCLPVSLRAADLNGDGAMDLAVAGGGGSPRAVVALGDGAGSLEFVAESHLSGAPSDVATGDLDSDGLADLVLTEPAPGLLSSRLLDSSEPRPTFIRGDGNADGTVDISDPVLVLLHLFLGAEARCLESLDANDDVRVDVSDPVYLLDFLFRGGPAPPAPFPLPGADPEPDTLSCPKAP
jgi:hypothetical protein